MQEVTIEEKETKEQKKNEDKVSIWEYARTCLIAAAIAAFFVIFIGKPAMVIGTSMVPTLQNGDLLFAEKITKNYDRFDIIIFKSPVDGRILIKRVIALPGESIEIKDNDIYINDKKIDDPISVEMDYYGIASEKIILDENEYFVMGDNRNDSMDSRYPEIGKVNKSQIKGHIVFGIKPIRFNIK